MGAIFLQQLLPIDLSHHINVIAACDACLASMIESVRGLHVTQDIRSLYNMMSHATGVTRWRGGGEVRGGEEYINYEIAFRVRGTLTTC